MPPAELVPDVNPFEGNSHLKNIYSVYRLNLY